MSKEKRFVKMNLIRAAVCLSVFALTAVDARAQVGKVEMRIDGYLCGN